VSQRYKIDLSQYLNNTFNDSHDDTFNNVYNGNPDGIDNNIDIDNVFGYTFGCRIKADKNFPAFKTVSFRFSDKTLAEGYAIQHRIFITPFSSMANRPTNNDIDDAVVCLLANLSNISASS
jgi:hypothetical protein